MGGLRRPDRSRSRSRSLRTHAGSPVLGRTDFGGGRVHVIQVGLGNNGTFLQNLGGKCEELDFNIQYLLRSMSEMRPEHLLGIGVEPVQEYINGLSELASDVFPNVALVEVALGEHEESDREMHVFSPSWVEELLKQASDPRDKKFLSFQCEYLMNMSSVGSVHPEIPERLDMIKKRVGPQVNATLLNPQLRQTKVWTWSKLAHTLNFSGCELLLIDAEGQDAMILRSLISHCLNEEDSTPDVWPDIIQLETMGLCDKREGCGTEWDIIGALQGCGYIILHYSNFNTKLARTRLVNDEWGRIWWWAWRSFHCTECYCHDRYPFTESQRQIYCRWCCARLTYAAEREPLPPTSVADLTPEMIKLSEALEKTLLYPEEELHYVRGDHYVLLSEALEHALQSLGKKALAGSESDESVVCKQPLDASTLDIVRKIVAASQAGEKSFPQFDFWDREGDDYWIRLRG